MVGGADQPVDGNSHGLGIIGRQDIAEIAGGHAHVDGLALGDGPGLEQVAVSGGVVHDLGQDTSPIDGVGGGQKVPPFRQLRRQSLVGKQRLYPGLRVVEIAHNGAHAHVAPLLGDHLELLDLGHPVLGIKHQNSGLIHVAKALQSGLARVAGGGDQNTHRLFLVVLLQGRGQQMGQDLERHVLKGAGRPVPQLQAVGAVVQLDHRGDVLAGELPAAVGLSRVGGELGGGKSLQKAVHDVHHPLLVRHLLHGLHSGGGQAGQHRRSQQAAVGGQSLGDGLGRAHVQIFISRAQVIHGHLTTLIKLL